MRRLSSRRRRKMTAVADISLTPLIDTALTLLIIFMVTAPMMQNAIRVTLPKGQAKEAGGAREELVVFVDQEGLLFFNGTKLAQADLVDAVKKKVGTQQDATVFVKADRAVAYGTVIELVDSIKVIGGVKYVAMATQKLA